MGGTTYGRERGINALSLAHKFIKENVKPGDFCIDATAGRGKDTAFLCSLAGETGRVVALDIQQDAVESTQRLLEEKGFTQTASVFLDSHANIKAYAAPESVDCIVFNFGWLPGGSHDIFTAADTSIEAIKCGLELLKPGGVMSLCIYYGRNNGYGERDAILEYLKTLDYSLYTVIVHNFWNRVNDPAIPVFIIKQL